MGDDGLIKQAEQAGQHHANGVKAEDEALDNLLLEYEIAIGEKGPNGKPTLITVTSINHTGTAAEDKLGNPVYIPGGFKIHTDSADTVDEGIVITDGTNEFVWVPVSEESFNNMFKTANPKVALSGSTGVTSSYYSNLRVASEQSTDYPIATVTSGTYSSTDAVREPDLVTTYDSDSYAVQAGYDNLADMAQGFVDDYANMRASIEKYDGFYIGRYELTGTVDNPTVKSGAVLTGDASQAGNWYGLYKACTNVKKGDTYVTSTMIWGCQWDETMNWLKNTKFKNNISAVDTDSSSWGNYGVYNTTNGYEEGDAEYISVAGLPQNTGYSEYWSANKIYDLAGNYIDWTQEAYAVKKRVQRGGYYGELDEGENFATMRRNTSSHVGASNYSARVTLYINL